MFIENRINKRTETDSCILILLNENHREKLVRQITKWFFRTIVWCKSNESYFTNNFVTLIEKSIEADNSELQEQWSFNLQPKQQLFAKLKQKKLNLFSKKWRISKRLFKRKRA